DEIEVCTHYLINGKEVYDFPFDVNDDKIIPVYKTLKGWSSDLTSLSSYEESPEALKNYVSYLEAQLNVPISVVSVGPDRKQTLITKR
ncbi:MAG TPA: adenylosuccinate synthase, partial [Crocinitomicaceae bacterium]|nr:adenylosuccinate synthase [Crocinitomicaceae bacterium]